MISNSFVWYFYIMEWTVLLAVIAFKTSTYEVQHYPMQVSPWVQRIEYDKKAKGQLKVYFKHNTFSQVPKCRWSSLDTNSKAVGTVTYFSAEEIGIVFFEKDKKGKDQPKDISFILSCRAPK